ncbi:Pff1p [Sporobolomyces salmoneus]|uniref:Pff1p n=1 Tax=Sporobolomyces salmoneus TaxID=183962 RepID=UPI0031817B66
MSISDSTALRRTKPQSHHPTSRAPLGLFPSLLILLPILSLLTYTSVHLHYKLPTPEVQEWDLSTQTPIFSEGRAMKYIKDLASYNDVDSTPRYRIVGTKEMQRTDEYLLAAIEEIRREMVEQHPNGGMQLEVWHQIGDGSHLFDFMDKMVWKKYFGISNIVVRLSDGTPSTKANAILVNAHTDSTLPSPGAADDLVGVAAMLESMRVMALGKRRLTNSVVFLFNGAEESLQDASHLFITQHPLKDTVRGVINLEACGTDGKEITFQATSEEMVRALARTPTPYATIIASEIFQTGLILSDTDFRQFAEYGNLTGLDMALVQRSYYYHTRLDRFESIQPGSVQHMGESTLALLTYFTSNETTLGNSPLATPILPKTPVSALIFFSALGGKIFIVYTRYQATILYTLLAGIVSLVLYDRVDWENKRKTYLLSAFGVLGSLLSGVIGANLGAAFTSVVMGRAMSWFRNEALPLVVYGPPALLGIVLYQYFFVSNRLRSPLATIAQDRSESSLLEHSSLVGLVIYYTTFMLLGHAAGVGSSYLFAIGSAGSLLALCLNDYVLHRDQGREEKSVNLITYIAGQILPILLGVEGIIGFLDLFVPLTGRLGADAPVDFIIATLTSAVGFLIVPMFLPFIHRFGASFTARLVVLFTLTTIISLSFFTRSSWSPYDAQHPKRIFVLHMENTSTTPSEFHAHVASIDGNPFLDLVTSATHGLIPQGQVPEPTVASDLSVDWDIIYPIGQFLTTYKVPLHPVAPNYVSPWSDFKVMVEKSHLDVVNMRRSIDLVLEHPGVIWPVIAFEADVVSWDLPRAPERGMIRHHVKSVASYGINRFPLSVTIQLDPSSFSAALREEQRAKNQRIDFSLADKELGTLKIDYSGLDPLGMYPASLVADDDEEQALRDKAKENKLGLRFFKELEKRLEKEPVDSMLLSAVAGQAYV